MIEELLYFAEWREWSGQCNTSCHCHPKFVNCCPACRELESVGVHKEDCTLISLINDAQKQCEKFELAEEFISFQEEDVSK